MNSLSPDSGYGTTEPRSQQLSMQNIIAKLLRGRWIILASFGFVLLVTVVYTLVTKTVYESTSLVLLNIHRQGAQFSITEAANPGGDNKIANELGQLKSRLMADAVARRVLQNPYLDKDRKVLTPVVLRSGGSSEDSSIAFAEPSQVAGRIQRTMDFSPERESDVIKITARSSDPREAALLANGYAEVYQEYGVSSSRSRSKSSREFLQEQLAAKHRTLDSCENALKGYMQSSGLVSLDAQASRVTQQLSQLEANRDAIDIDIESLDRTLTTYQQRLPEQEKEVGRVMRQANDPYIKLIQEQLANLQVQRDVLASPNPTGVGGEVYAEKLKSIEGQIANLQKKLEDRTVSYLQTLPSGETGAAQADPAGYLVQAKQKIFETQMQIQALMARKSALNKFIRQYEGDFTGIPRKSIEFARLQRARLSAEKLYLLVEEKYNDAAIGEKSDFGYIDIIDTAIVPVVPVSPNVPFNIMMSVILGFGLGVAIVFVRENLDVRVNTPEDLKQRGYPFFSFVGRIGDADTKSPQPARSTGERKFPETMVSIQEPFSPASESYRRLRAKLEFTLSEDRPRTVIVSSPNPGEGKTTTIINLGIAFAQAERKVLIVDADLRRPAVHLPFKLPLTPGLSELLTGRATHQHVLHKNVLSGLDVICGGIQSIHDPEILSSKHMSKFLKEVAPTYDWVLIDTSPILAVSDPASLAAMVDGTLLVVSGGETRVVALDRAAEFVSGSGGKIVGVFLNNFNAQQAYGSFYGSDRYGYYKTAYGRSTEAVD